LERRYFHSVAGIEAKQCSYDRVPSSTLLTSLSLCLSGRNTKRGKFRLLGLVCCRQFSVSLSESATESETPSPSFNLFYFGKTIFATLHSLAGHSAHFRFHYCRRLISSVWFVCISSAVFVRQRRSLRQWPCCVFVTSPTDCVPPIKRCPDADPTGHGLRLITSLTLRALRSSVCLCSIYGGVKYRLPIGTTMEMVPRYLLVVYCSS